MRSYNITNLGTRLLSLRENKNFTQKELSTMIGLTPKMISFYENNQRMPPADILVKLCEIFDVSTDYLLGEDSCSSSTSELSLPTMYDKELLEVISMYSSLNNSGKEKIIQYLQDLCANPRNLQATNTKNRA